LAVVSDQSADKNENSQQNYELMVTQEGGNIEQLHGKGLKAQQNNPSSSQTNQNPHNFEKVKGSS
jgi:hypothetical protein